MPELQFSFNTGSVPLSRIVNAICLEYNYKATIRGEANPETKAEFAKRMIGDHIRNIVYNQETELARKAAESDATIDLI
jgi:hypothetical protein